MWKLSALETSTADSKLNAAIDYDKALRHKYARLCSSYGIPRIAGIANRLDETCTSNVVNLSKPNLYQA